MAAPMTLREFLERGLWPIEKHGDAPIMDGGGPPMGYRPATDQAARILLATGRHLRVTRDTYNDNIGAPLLEQHLRLDDDVPPDLLEQFEAATVSAQYFAPLTEANLHGALSHAYALVNRIVVDPTLRRNPYTAHLWTTWNLEGDTTYLARGIEGSPTTSSGTTDGACIVNHGPVLQAIALLETKIAALFLTYRRATFNEVLTERGFDLYLSWASNRPRAWNCPLIDGCAAFWTAVLVTCWESMHVYKCDRYIVTSWLRSSMMTRRGPNLMTGSFLIAWGPRPEQWNCELPYLSLFQVLLAAALRNQGDEVESFVAYPGTPNVTLRRQSACALDTGVASLPPTLPTLVYGWHPDMSSQSSQHRSHNGHPPSPMLVHLFQTVPDDDETVVSFLELATEASDVGVGHTLVLDHPITTGQVYRTARVQRTTFVPAADVPPAGLVARIVDLGRLPYTDMRWSLSRAAVQRQVRDEAALYCGALAPLQGKVVPRFYGLFEGHYGKAKAGIMIMLLENVGEPLARGVADLNRTQCDEVVAAYTALHNVHVVHGDYGVQHATRAADGTVRLVDFEHAWAVNPRRRRERADVDDEHRCVLREFGCEVPPHLRDLVPPWEMSDSDDDGEEDAATPRAG